MPYAIARTDSLFPESGPAVASSVVGVAVVLTLAAALAAARRALRSPAIEAVKRQVA